MIEYKMVIKQIKDKGVMFDMEVIKKENMTPSEKNYASIIGLAITQVINEMSQKSICIDHGVEKDVAEKLLSNYKKEAADQFNFNRNEMDT